MNNHLTPRQVEILQLSANGKTNQEMAEELFISCTTVKTHKINIKHNLCASNLPHAVALGFRSGILS